MERPAKRQKLYNSNTRLSSHHVKATARSSTDLVAVSIPTRTLHLADFQRPPLHFGSQNYPRSPPGRRYPGRVILPRAPDVTVTSDVLEVAVNGGVTSTEIAVPTADVAVTLNSLGTVTIPAQITSSTTSSSSGSESSILSSLVSSFDSNTSTGATGIFPSTSGRNDTSLSTSTTDRTVTITATSTFRVSYTNGTFIAPTTTRSSETSVTHSNDLGITTTVDFSSQQSGPSSSSEQTVIYITSGFYTSAGNTPGVGATATGSGPSESTTSTSGGGDGGNGGGSNAPVLTPQQTQVVGGVVGGVAGIALVAFALLYVLRWYRVRLSSKTGLKRLIDFDPAHDHGVSGLVNTAAPMSSTTAHTSFFPAASALLTSPSKWRAGLETLNRSGTTLPEPEKSEKGFQRISGRKIPPVLATGGDPYDDSNSSFRNNAYDEKIGMAISTPTRPTPYRSTQRILSDSSVYSDFESPYNSHRHYESYSEPTTPVYGGTFLHNQNYDRIIRRPPLSHTRSYHDIALEDLSRALTTADVSRPDGFAVIRNSPARTPVTQSPSVSSIMMPVQAPVSMDEDVPEMPLSPLSTGYPAYGLGLGQDLVSSRRIPSRVESARNYTSSNNGRFREELN